MARSPVIRVTFPGRIAWEGRFARLLAAVNSGNATPEIEAAIETIASGRALELSPDSTMIAWDWITLRNWSAYARAGVRPPRRCPECQLWFLAFKKTQHTCRRLACKTAYAKADARRRRKKSYDSPGARRLRELQRRPRVTETST